MHQDSSRYKARTADIILLRNTAPLSTMQQARALLKRHRHKLLALVFWLLLLGSYFWYTVQHNMTPLDTASSLVVFLQQPYGPLVYIMAFAVRPLVLFSATLLTMVAGSIFGPVWGILFTMVASNISASLVYGAGRFMGYGVLDEHAPRPQGTLRRYAARLRRSSFMTVLTLNLMLMLPFDLISYTSGFLHIRYRPFILGTLLGSIPGIVGCVLIGASVQVEMSEGFMLPSIHPWTLVLALALFLATITFSRYLRRRQHWSEEEE